MAIANNATKDPSEGGFEPLYAEAVKIHPRKVKGTFRNLKWWTVIVLLGFYHLAPFLRWDRGPGAPDQAILVDIMGRRAYFFFIEIWPQEVYYFTGILALAAIGLFLMSALAGRVWCGFGCWQTVYTDLFVAVEQWIVGDRNARIMLDRKAWSTRKLVKRSLVIGVWLLISLACGIGFTLFFGDAHEMLAEIFTLDADAAVYGTIGIIGGFCFLLAGWAREQVCIYMCPYSRFQAAMFDEHSLLVSYEGWRGEPRGSAKRGQSFEGRGHCIDCKMCVHACPTGIDIREGSQLACIGCGLCIDACNTIMDKFDLPRGLIRYDSDHNVERRAKGQSPEIKLVRTRTVIYTALVALIGAVMMVAFGNRSTTEVNMQHERTPMFVQLSDGSIRNGYTYKILNKIREDRSFKVEVSGLDGATLEIVGGDQGVKTTNLDVRGDDIGTFRMYVSAPADKVAGAARMTFILTAPDGTIVRNESIFAGPER